MKNFFYRLILPIIFLLLTSCGKKGPIKPPIVKAPKEIEKFAMFQRGDKVRLRWQNPIAYKDGAPLDTIGEVEVWLATEERAPKDNEGEEEHVILEQISGKDFQKKAELILTIRGNELSNYVGGLEGGSPVYLYFYDIEDKDFLAKKYIFGLRVRDRKNRVSGFSEILSVEPRAMPLPPQNLVVSVHPDHIELKWDPPEKNIDDSTPANVAGYNIYRKDHEGIETCLNSELIKDTEFKDLKFLFGETYHYYIRALPTPSAPYLQSLDSEPVEILPKDTFPPQPPVGLIGMSGVDSISLSWDKSMELDFSGYRVWRKKEGEEEYTLLTPGAIRENTFTDTTIEKGIRYHYAVTAVDKHGNESERSDSVSEIRG